MLKFPPGVLWYVCSLVTLPHTTPLLLESRGVVDRFDSSRIQFTNIFFLSVVIVLFKFMGVLMMILRKTEHIWRILIRKRVLNSLCLGFNTEDRTKILSYS